jgi:hypothetical protein
MWLVPVAQAERRGEVVSKELLLLDRREQRLVNRLLVFHPSLGHLLLLQRNVSFYSPRLDDMLDRNFRAPLAPLLA